MSTSERIAEYKRLIAAKEEEITRLKLELAECLLAESEEKDEGFTTLVGVQFNGKGKVYDYIWADECEVAVGDTVMVETRWSGMQCVEVVRVKQEKLFGMTDGYKCAYATEGI